ncbi:YjbQ family protein [bacterium]|nr:YjbQ family protein [bacterium]
MASRFKKIRLSTKGFADVIDITAEVRGFIDEVDESDGLLTVMVPGATGAVTTIEYESGLVNDFKKLLEELIPQDGYYEHNERWGDGNGFSHLRASLLGPSLTIPFKSNRPLLGTWQQVVFCDFDNRRREREIVLSVVF